MESIKSFARIFIAVVVFSIVGLFLWAQVSNYQNKSQETKAEERRPATTVVATGLSDAQARNKAINMERLIAVSRDEMNASMKNGDKTTYKKVADRLLGAVKQWPDNNLAGRAIFPYFACKQAAISLLQYGDAWARNDQSKSWRDHAIKNFKEDYAGCKSSIEKPDMSLKDVQ